MTTSLPPVFGGRTKSLLRRVDLLSREAGLPFTIITANYRPDYHLNYELYYRRGWVQRSVKFLNIYNDVYLQGGTTAAPLSLSALLGSRWLLRFKHPGKPIRYCFDLRGRYTHLISHDGPQGSLARIDDILPGTVRPVRRRQFDAAGHCHREVRLPADRPKERQETYYDYSGQPYLEITREGASKAVVSIREVRTGKVFATYRDFLGHVLPQLAEDAESFIVDTRLWDKPVIEAGSPRARKISVLHNPHRSHGAIKASYSYLLATSEKATSVVTLTEKQKADWIADGAQGVTTVIPHSTDLTPPHPAPRRDPNKIICLSRLAEQKRIDHAIKAFALVARTHPKAKLEIFGSGRTRAALEQTIRDCSLDHQCLLRGRTDDPQAALASAACSLHTSLYEGQCLSVLESLASGCPAISYDISYGPGEMVKDGVSGFLVPPGDLEALAEAMRKVLDGWSFRVTVPERYRDRAFIDSWRQLLAA